MQFHAHSVILGILQVSTVRFAVRHALLGHLPILQVRSVAQYALPDHTLIQLHLRAVYHVRLEHILQLLVPIHPQTVYPAVGVLIPQLWDSVQQICVLLVHKGLIPGKMEPSLLLYVNNAHKVHIQTNLELFQFLNAYLVILELIHPQEVQQVQALALFALWERILIRREQRDVHYALAECLQTPLGQYFAILAALERAPALPDQLYAHHVQ